MFGSSSFLRRRATARRLRVTRCSSVVVGACRHRRRRHCVVPCGLHRGDTQAAARHSTLRASCARPGPAAEAPSALRVGLVIGASIAGTRTIRALLFVLPTTPLRAELPDRLLVLRVGVLVRRLLRPFVRYTAKGVRCCTYSLICPRSNCFDRGTERQPGPAASVGLVVLVVGRR